MMVRMPEAAEQVANVPMKLLRGIFAGIGQLLLAADRFRAEEAEREEKADVEHHDPLTPSRSHPREVGAARSGQSPERTTFRSLDSTGNVRILAPGEVPDVPNQPSRQPRRPHRAPTRQARQSRSTRAARQPRPAQAARQPRQGDSARQARTSRRAPQKAPTLPVPGYDGLSLASLRSRLRNLDPDQLRVLVDYEKSHGNRDDVVTMFERRIVKLEAPVIRETEPDAS
jgi:hypothetical protein